MGGFFLGEGQMTKDDSTPATAERAELRRDVTIWGSSTWGYADVGADI